MGERRLWLQRQKGNETFVVLKVSVKTACLNFSFLFCQSCDEGLGQGFLFQNLVVNANGGFCYTSCGSFTCLSSPHYLKKHMS